MSAKLTELSAFVAVARHLSFQRAALERGTTRAAISHAVIGLERELSVRLLNRTTRSVSLTEAGALLYARLEPAFGEITLAVEAINRFRETPYGIVRLNVPRAVATSFMGPVMALLVRENPGLQLEISSDDRLVDIVAEAYDAGIRFGERLAQNMIAVRIGFPLSFAVVGSPDYLAAHPAPSAPADLRRHRCIRYRFPSGAMFPWEFERNGQSVQVAVNGPISLDDQELMIEAALAGAGLAFVFAERVAHHLASGRLVRCLTDWSPSLTNLFLYYPDRTYVPAGLRKVIDVLKKPPKAAFTP
jgi:DNA-binding transcriptional LysR family regulator